MVDKDEIEWTFLLYKIQRSFHSSNVNVNLISQTSEFMDFMGYIGIVFVNLYGVDHRILMVFNMVGKNKC